MAQDEELLIIEQVKATHDPNCEIDVNANFLLKFVEDIFYSNTVAREVKHNKLQLQEHIQNDEIIISQVLRVSFEIMFNCLNNNGDSDHSIAIYVLSLLSKYPWQAKSAMMLSSFAIISGRFKLLVSSESCRRKGLAYNLTLLKTSLKLMSSSDNEKSDDDLIRSVLDLTKLTVELQHSSSMTLASYWISRFVVSYARLLILDLESQNQLRGQSILSTKIKEILTSSLPLLEAKRAEENYQALLHAFDNSSNIVDVLKLIFNVKNDEEKPFVFVYVGNEVCSVDRFEGDGVLLLISSGGKHFPSSALDIIRVVEMIWVPIINKNDTEEEHIVQFPYSVFSYFGVLDPQKWISPQFISFLVNKCGFQEGCDPIIISLDKRGRLVHSNALHMLFTWAPLLLEESSMRRFFAFRDIKIIPSLENELRERTLGADRVITDIHKQIIHFARDVRNNINNWLDDIRRKTRSSFRSYNYTSKREEALWEEDKQSSSWGLMLLLNPSPYYFKHTLQKWIGDENYIFLCGGNNIIRVQEFIHQVRSKFQMNMKIAYVGGRGRRKMIQKERMQCDYSFNISDFKNFWARLQSMTFSRMQYLRKARLDEESDEIMQGLKKMLTYYEADECTTIGAWALLSKGNRIIACDMRDKMLAVMNDLYEKWKDNADANGFDQAFKDHYDMLSSSSSTQHPCCALNIPSNLDRIPETLSCPQCDHNMHKFVTFSCYHGPTNDLHYEIDE